MAKSQNYAHFNEMTWPVPGEGSRELEWRMRYGTPSQTDRYLAASIISAYEALIAATQPKRAHVVREIRKRQT